VTHCYDTKAAIPRVQILRHEIGRLCFFNLADTYPDTDPNPDKETCKSGPRGLKMAKPSGSNVRSIFSPNV